MNGNHRREAGIKLKSLKHRKYEEMTFLATIYLDLTCSEAFSLAAGSALIEEKTLLLDFATQLQILRKVSSLNTTSLMHLQGLFNFLCMCYRGKKLAGIIVIVSQRMVAI